MGAHAAMTFGEYVWKRRNEIGMSQQDLADRAGMRRSALSMVEHRDSEPSFSRAARILHALDVSLDDAAKAIGAFDVK